MGTKGSVDNYYFSLPQKSEFVKDYFYTIIRNSVEKIAGIRKFLLTFFKNMLYFFFWAGMTPQMK